MELLVKLFGPVREKVTLAVAQVAVRFKVLPLQMGNTFPATGVAGGLGSVMEKGPTPDDEHPLTPAVILS